jgi:hypothetical protein
MVTDRDPLDELVRALARVRDEDLVSASKSPAAKALFEEVTGIETREVHGTRKDAARRRGARSRRARSIALLAAALLIIGGGASYAASTWLSPSEQVPLIDQLGRSIPLPPNGNFDAVRVGIERDPGQQEVAGLNGALAFAATCQWYGYWLDGSNSGNQDQMAAAAETIDAIPSWPQLVAVGSGPDSTVDYLKQLAASVDAGDPSPVRQFLIANCSAEPWFDSATG